MFLQAWNNFKTYSWHLDFVVQIDHKVPPPNKDHVQVNGLLNDLVVLLLEQILCRVDLQIHHDPMIDNVLKK